MRVKCQLKVVNYNNPSCSGGKSAQAAVFVAKTVEDLFLVYCTAKNKQGVKHKVKDNVKCIFGKFIQDGMATIQLKDPPINICVSKAQPQELKNFLCALKVASSGESISGRGILSSMAPARAKHVQRPTTKMVVKSKQDYPLKGFPSTLENLTVTTCALTRIDSRIFALKSLVELDLSSNSIKNIPEALTKLNRLAKLNLSLNSIECLTPAIFSQDSNLIYLDLSHNDLKFLPRSICKLRKLWHLNVNHNALQCLPRQIGQLCNLRTLSVSDNHLLFLPIGLWHLNMLSSIDLFKNRFLCCENSTLHNRAESYFCENQVPTLQQLAGRKIKSEKLNYNHVDIVPYPLIRFLDSGLQCRCKTYCFEDRVRYIACSTLDRLCSNVTRACEFCDANNAFFQVGVCSTKCLNFWEPDLRAYGR